jgi:hypothetical protein
VRVSKDIPNYHRDLKIGNWNGKPIVECIHSRIKFHSNSKGPPFFLRRTKGRD